MSSTMTIKDVAQASGFSATTLRYYEQLGILPPPSRTAAGYRIYDERALQRLAFVARAKQLGCTLEDIAGLTSAWDGGECGPIQQRLQQLVDGKLVATRARIAELVTFAAELEAAASALERHRPDGACDDACGCISTTTTAGSGEPTITCTLAAGAMKGRLDEWEALLSHAAAREPIDGGIRVVFRADVPTGELMRLVAAEQQCCQFFRFAITVDARGVALEVRAPDDARSIVDALFAGAA